MTKDLIEKLYYDKKFDAYISKLARLRNIEFEELKQDAFVEMLFADAEDTNACKRALRRVADRKTKNGPYNYTYDDDLSDSADGMKGSTKDWYWRGADPRMNEDVDPSLAWT